MMQNDSSGLGGLLDAFREWRAEIALVGSLLVAGVLAKLGKIFPTRKEHDALREKVKKQEANMDIVERRVTKNERDIEEIQEHGSDASRAHMKETTQQLAAMNKTLAVVADRVDWLVRKNGGGA